MDVSTLLTARLGRRIAMALLVVTANLQGCSNYQVRVADGKPLGEAYETEVVQAYGWANWMSPLSVTGEECKQGLYDVIVEPNYLYDLASVFTLGLWMPREVGYRCKAPGVQPGGTLPP